MIKAVIFDMDGTMVNSQKLWDDVSQRLAALYGVIIDKELQRRMMGKKDNDSLAAFKDYHHLDVEVQELIRVRREMILRDVGLVETNKGLYELLDLLDRLEMKKAVATSAFREFTSKILSSFDLEKRFDTVITGDDITLGKPDPMIFLEAARRLDVSPKDCLVLEDAENGVEAASKAGMPVFAIPHGASDYHDFSKATKVLGSMLEIDEAMLASL
jgi:HAD superfamily hydrolase (TIGR01549 family)